MKRNLNSFTITLRITVVWVKCSSQLKSLRVKWCSRASCYFKLRYPYGKTFWIFGSSPPTYYKAGKSYIKNTGDLLEKLKNHGNNIPSNAVLVTAGIVGLYPSIPHDAGLQALYEKLEERAHKNIPSTDLVEMAEFKLKNNFVEFEIKSFSKFLEQPWELRLPHQMPYASLFMDRMESDLLYLEVVKPWLGLRYIFYAFIILVPS